MRLKMGRDKAEIKKEAEGISHKGTEARMQGTSPASSNHMNQINQVKQMNEIKEINEINQTNQINQINANNAKESEVRTVMGGVSGRGNHFLNLKSQISNLKSLRMALMAVLAVMMVCVSIPADAAFDQLDNWNGYADNGTTFGPNWTAPNGSDGTSCWYTEIGPTPSNGVGPSAGNPDPYVYLETSSTSATNGCGVAGGSTQYFEEVNTHDAGLNRITLEFDWNMNLSGEPDGSLYVDVWNGTSWDLAVTGGPINTGDNGDVWVHEVIDLDALGYNSGQIKVRFRYVVGNGSTWHYDLGLDNIHIYGVDRCQATAPTDLTANAVSATQVDLAWTFDGTSNDYYNIYRDGVQIATNITTGSYTDTTVSPSTTYNYTVRGYSNAGACESGDSNVATVTTPSCTDPDPTTGVSVTPASGSTVNGTVTVQATISGESTPGSGSATVTISGSTACDVTNQTMTWNSGTGAFEYSWDTSACGNPAENPITISVDYTDPDCGAVTTGSSTNITIDNTGPKYTVSSCSDCHDYPPTDATGQRNTPVGAVVGSHSKHPFDCSKCHIKPTTFDHRNGNIDMANPINGDTGASYSKGTSFPQVNDLTGSGLGTCSNVSCHGGSTTPTWGTTGALTCSSCHTNDMGLTATVRRGIFKAGNDFTKTSHHIAGTPADASCEVCHNRSNHTQEGDPVVRVFDEDTGSAILYDGTASSLTPFCLSCHDSDAASRLGANASKPFTDSGDNTAPPNIGWNSTASAHTALTDKCFGCHGNSGAAGTTLDPVINAHGSDSQKILRYTGWLSTDESGFCYNCHGNPTANGAQDDIQSVFGLTSAHGDQNCAACHNKHQAQPGLHTAQSGNIAPVNYGATVLDSAAVTWPASWSATDFNATTTKAATSTDEEWQLCLKCHNGGGAATTDIALEFNPNNASYHSVVQLNPNRNTETPGTGSGQGGPAFVSPWSANSRMTCSDCHTNSNGTQAQGPHGSAVAFVLVAPYDSTTGRSGTQNHLCFRCHDWEGYVNNNQECKNDPCQFHTGFSVDTQTNQSKKEFNLHAFHNRKGYSCRNCHLARPHGAQGGPNNITRAILLWQGSSTPAPYRQAGAKANEWLYIKTWQASPGNWNQNNCAINTSNGGH